MDATGWGLYVLLHGLLSLALLPILGWSRGLQGRVSPGGMLGLWWLWAGALFLLPLLMLQPWAMDRQLLPWFHASVQPLGATSSALPGPEAVLDPLAPLAISWPLSSELLARLAPPTWLWWLLPMVSAFKAVRLGQSYRRTRALRQQALIWKEAPAGCPVPVRVHPGVDSAMLVGLRQPEILLPSAYLQHLNAAQLALIVQHELCHQQQGDLRQHVLQQALSCLFWWSPAWRIAAQELSRWRELRCDALVSRQQAQPHRYAQTLLDCALLQQKQPGDRGPGRALAQRWWHAPLLALRIDEVLLQEQRPQRLWQGGLLALLLLGSSLFLTQHLQLADLPARHAQVSVSELGRLSVLLERVASQDVPGVQSLLAEGAPLNLARPGDGTPLMMAVRRQSLALVELLLKAGADANISSRGDGNALILAAQGGQLSIARHLLDAGADVNAAVLGDETPLIQAARRGDLAMAQLLLAHGALINLQVQTPMSDGRVWRSALNQASTPAMRELLLQRGAR
ncbi:MAG: hypothetical protein CFE41_14155 [Burkholderiales bacterium PBB2]|nr:MAG: hypothetical protein CFE41_14155 [Burkholderiales bacterium PBB2]